ncbi:MAG: hypothetical protein C4295_01460 [Candidatus Fervidibacterota bacterium]
MKPAQRDWLIREYGRRLQLPYPMGLLEMLEEALELYRRHFVVLFGIGLVPALLAIPLGMAGSLLEAMPSQHWPLFLAAVGLAYLFFLVSVSLGHGAQIWAAGKAIMGEPASFGEAWVAVLKRSGALLLSHFLALFPAMMGVLLCGVGVLVTMVLFYILLAQVILLERRAYLRAITRHVQLLLPNWGWVRVLAFSFLASLLTSSASMLIGWGGWAAFIVAEILREAMPIAYWVSLAVGQLWQQLASALVTPYLATFLTLLYFDLRARREAYDLQVLVERWDSLSPSQPMLR